MKKLVIIAKIFKVFAIVWSSLVVSTIFLSILGIFLTAPNFYQGWLKFTDIFSPFNVANYIVTIIVLSPAIGAYALYGYFKKKSDMVKTQLE